MNVFLCYDLKGIQSFVFRIPRLRYIIGGSALLDQLDRQTIAEMALPAGTLRLFSGGGHGAFRCPDEKAADFVQDRLLREARKIGADIAFARHRNYSEAVHGAAGLFPALPYGSDLDGHPCPTSGLYPALSGKEHEWSRVRTKYRRGDPVFRRFERELLDGTGTDVEPRVGVRLPSFVAEGVHFFHDIDADDGVDESEAHKAAAALGGRNRWAVIAMDGNDMGSQFRKQDTALGEDDLVRWIEHASVKLDACTRVACRDGLQAVVDQWLGDHATVERARLGDGSVILPVRPLLLGGDDLVVLCHVAHAMTFVREVCRSFAVNTRVADQEWRIREAQALWPATGGGLTISAGVLFTGVSVPLATAIQYAESLLASAKGRGRRLRGATPDQPTPACVDWETITSSVLEHPATARQRDWTFFDEDIEEQIELTRRPYELDELAELDRLSAKYEHIPRSILADLGQVLRTAYWDRQVWLARLSKTQPDLIRDLSEPPPKPASGEHTRNGSRWRREKRGESWTRSTDVLDALDLLTELRRLESSTKAVNA